MNRKHDYTISIRQKYMDVSLVNNTQESYGWGEDSKYSHYGILEKILNFLADIRGFQIGEDEEVKREYPSLSKDRWYGRKKDLEFKAERHPRRFEINFYQNVNYKNHHGGYYGSDKFELAPYLIRLTWLKEMKYLKEYISTLEEDIGIEEELEILNSEYNIKKHFQRHFDNEITIDSKLSDLDGLEGCDEYRKSGYKHNSFDRDGKLIVNGQIKYFRDYDGRLQRGKVYHNINNMWWVILNDTDYTNKATFDLFDLTEKDKSVRRIQRTRKEAKERSRIYGRKCFNNKLTYNDVTRKDIELLHRMISEELQICSEEKISMKMTINPVIKTKCNSKRKIEHAFLYVDAHYFERRECISFNRDGFIGFAGWADSGNIVPIIRAFEKWCKVLTKKKEDAILKTSKQSNKFKKSLQNMSKEDLNEVRKLLNEMDKED